MPDSFQKQVQTKIVKTAPRVLGTVINFTARAFVATFRFIGQMFQDALGK